MQIDPSRSRASQPVTKDVVTRLDHAGVSFGVERVDRTFERLDTDAVVDLLKSGDTKLFVREPGADPAPLSRPEDVGDLSAFYVTHNLKSLERPEVAAAVENVEQHGYILFVPRDRSFMSYRPDDMDNRRLGPVAAYHRLLEEHQDPVYLAAPHEDGRGVQDPKWVAYASYFDCGGSVASLDGHPQAEGMRRLRQDGFTFHNTEGRQVTAGEVYDGLLQRPDLEFRVGSGGIPSRPFAPTCSRIRRSSIRTCGRSRTSAGAARRRRRTPGACSNRSTSRPSRNGGTRCGT